MNNANYGRYYFRWLLLTLALVSVNAITVGYLSFSISKKFREEQVQLIRQLIVSTIDTEYPRLAEELYLNLDTLESRERALRQLVGKSGTIGLTFSRAEKSVLHPKNLSTPELHSVTRVTNDPDLLIAPIFFDDFYVGELQIHLRLKDASNISHLPPVTSLLLLSLVLASWIIAGILLRKTVFAPFLSMAQKEADAIAVGRLAQQVAHDIRSPLAALQVVTSRVEGMPEDVRILTRSAVQRITDIANELLRKNSKLASQNRPAKELSIQPVDSELLYTLLDTVVSEKRLEFRNFLGIDIRLHCDRSFFTFAKLTVSEFQRVISNIINNAVDASLPSGLITVTLYATEDRAIVKIEDNGVGIPEENLSSLGCRGFTANKSSGLGLGLFHAIQTIESFGGTLKITSQKAMGTTVEISLPAAVKPIWLATQLLLGRFSTLVIIDDDSSIHEIWRARISELRSIGFDGELKHFSTPSAFEGWRILNPKVEISVLMDYEFADGSQTGLDAILALSLQRDAYLQTSRFEDKTIRNRCAGLGIKILPKSIASRVPLKILSRLDAILIDDDPLIHATWALVASEKGKIVRTFYSVDEFLGHSEELPKQTPIYLDECLRNGESGIKRSKDLTNLGFKNLYLATGLDELPNTNDFSFVAVVGKEPPF